MQDFQQRVVDEKSELDDKIGRLRVFCGGTIFKALPLDEQDRLAEQLATMDHYSNVLADRIAHFEA
jgi:hypothetical protein